MQICEFFVARFVRFLHYKSITAGVSGQWVLLLAATFGTCPASPSPVQITYVCILSKCVLHLQSTLSPGSNNKCIYAQCDRVRGVWWGASANNDRQHKQTRTSDVDWRLWPQGRPQEQQRECQDAGHAYTQAQPHLRAGARAGHKLGTSLVSAFCT